MTNKMKTFLFRIISIYFILFLISPSILFAGKLDDFEEESTKKYETSENDLKDTSSGDSNNNGMGEIFDKESLDDSFSNCLFGMTVGVLYAAGKYSFDQRRYNESLIGTPILPTISLDLDYQNVESDIYSINSRIEVGYGPFGFQYKELRYFEKDPDDKLRIYQFNYLHRMSDGKYFRIDLGMGTVTIKGDKSNTGFSLLTPIYLFLPKNCSLFLRPNWGWINGNTLQDYKLGFLFSIKYLSIQGGYRFVESGNETLNGPFIGFNLHY